MSYNSTAVNEVKFYSLPESVYQELVQSNGLDENAFYMTTGSGSGTSYVEDEVLYLGELIGGGGSSSSGSLVVKATGTLLSTGWDAESKTQTAEVTGVLADSAILVGPHPDSLTAYGDSQIYATAQANNSITFTCETIPTTNITVNVFIF